MARTDSTFKGYRARFKKGGKVLRETTSEHKCPVCEAEGKRFDDGSLVMGLYTRVWIASDVKGSALYKIEGTCPAGHDVERYGYANIPEEPKARKIITVGGKE